MGFLSFRKKVTRPLQACAEALCLGVARPQTGDMNEDEGQSLLRLAFVVSVRFLAHVCFLRVTLSGVPTHAICSREGRVLLREKTRDVLGNSKK